MRRPSAEDYETRCWEISVLISRRSEISRMMSRFAGSLMDVDFPLTSLIVAAEPPLTGEKHAAKQTSLHPRGPYLSKSQSPCPEETITCNWWSREWCGHAAAWWKEPGGLKRKVRELSGPLIGCRNGGAVQRGRGCWRERPVCLNEKCQGESGCWSRHTSASAHTAEPHHQRRAAWIWSDVWFIFGAADLSSIFDALHSFLLLPRWDLM